MVYQGLSTESVLQITFYCMISKDYELFKALCFMGLRISLYAILIWIAIWITFERFCNLILDYFWIRINLTIRHFRNSKNKIGHQDRVRHSRSF